MCRYKLTGILPLAALVAGLGCGQTSNPIAPARISGKISYKGQPIKAGVMNFYTPEGVAYSAQISKDGTYSATDIPAGELVVTVETESLSPARKGGAEAALRQKMSASMVQQRPGGTGGGTAEPEPYIKIPNKYANPKTSPLTVTTKPGRQVHDIDLTD